MEMIESGKSSAPETLQLPSKCQIGDKVVLDFCGAGLIVQAVIQKVKFSESKVTYDVIIYTGRKEDKFQYWQILTDIDSEYVKPSK